MGRRKACPEGREANCKRSWTTGKWKKIPFPKETKKVTNFSVTCGAWTVSAAWSSASSQPCFHRSPWPHTSSWCVFNLSSKPFICTPYLQGNVALVGIFHVLIIHGVGDQILSLQGLLSHSVPAMKEFGNSMIEVWIWPGNLSWNSKLLYHDEDICNHCLFLVEAK